MIESAIANGSIILLIVILIFNEDEGLQDGIAQLISGASASVQASLN